MKKILLLIGFSFILLLGNLKVNAASCTSCNAPDYTTANCGYSCSPGGTNPTTDQCGTQCTTQYGVPYCANGGAFLNTTDGELVIYGAVGQHYTLYVNGSNVQSGTIQNNGTSTGIVVHVNDRIGLTIPSALGWRYTDSSSYDSAIISAGYTIVNRQFLADSCSGAYDSFDFNDWVLVSAVKKVECDDSDINLSSNPTNLTHMILGVNNSVTLTRTGTTSLSQYLQVSNVLSTPGAYNCNWSLLQSSDQVRSVTCSVDKKPDYPATLVTWTHTWCDTDNGSCSGKKLCSKSLSLDIDPYGAYMRTDFGNSYIKGNTSLPRFPMAQRFSTYNYSTAGTYFPSSQSWLSTKNYLLLNYNDSNARSDFYDYLYSRIGVVAKTTTKPTGITLTNANYNLDVGSNDVVVVNGNLTLSSVSCNSRTIFFVSGNLIDNSNFDIVGNNACMFIVKGLTLVDPSVTTMNAFVVSNNFDSQLGGAQYLLKGGLIIQTSNSFKRNINLYITEASLINKTTPSELLTYEGARYIKLLGHLLNAPVDLNIREIQYTNNAN